MTVVNCRNVRFEKIDLRHSPGMGVYGLRSENILLKAVCTVVNRSEKRRFSCAADAFHFTNCRGLIELDDCNCNGQGDDALNIHGIYARIVAVSKDRKQIELFGVRFPAERVFKADDEIWPIVRTTGSRGARNRIERIVRKSSKRLVVALREPLDKTFRKTILSKTPRGMPTYRFTIATSGEPTAPPASCSPLPERLSYITTAS